MAYFTDGRDISNRTTLIDVVAEAGLDRSKVEGVLNGDDGMEALQEADELTQRFRVEGARRALVKSPDIGCPKLAGKN